MESLADQHESDTKNAQWVTETVHLFPDARLKEVTDVKTGSENTFLVINEERKVTHHTGFEVVYNPDTVLKVHGLLTNVLWLERNLGQAAQSNGKNRYLVHQNIFYRSPAYIVGANPDRGLLCATLNTVTRPSSYSENVVDHKQVSLIEISGHTAKKLAKHYAKIQQKPDTEAIKKLFDPTTKKFHFTSNNPISVVIPDNEKTVETITKLSETQLREYQVLEHLMNLAALFEVQRDWNRTLDRFTVGVSAEQVQTLKEMLEKRYGIHHSPQLEKASH